MDIGFITQIFLGISALIMAVSAFYKSMNINKKGYKTLVLIIGLCAVSIILASAAIYFSALKLNKTIKGHILEKRKELCEIDGSVSKLQRYIEEQNILLSQAKETISRLEKRKKELVPLVNTDDSTIDIVAKIHENDISEHILRERLVGAFIGILGLLLVVVFMNILKIHLKK
ncbi:MAG: hypothetical protein PHO00_07490 [bacterium]|nr:hypothetical protein [bacterium]